MNPILKQQDFASHKARNTCADMLFTIPCKSWGLHVTHESATMRNLRFIAPDVTVKPAPRS